MAGTGILVAGHGAALVNSIFLPQVRGYRQRGDNVCMQHIVCPFALQHAVVIELFPYLMKKWTCK